MSQLSPHQVSELATLRQQLQDAADSLAALCAQDPAASHSAPLPHNVHDTHDTQDGEIRAYYLSPEALRYEKTLQQEYKVATFNGLLAETHTRLMGLARVMMAMPPNGKLNGKVVAGLGGVLDQTSQLVWRMGWFADKVTRTDLPTA